MPPISPDLHTEFLDYRCGDEVFEAYVAHDGAAGRRPTVLIAHDWSGQNAGIRGEETGDNTHLLMPLLAERALLRRRLLAGLDAARRHPAVDARRIAAVGYCLGGLCVLDLARAGADVRGVVSFHGLFAPPNLGPQAPITAKVLLLHGWDDPMAVPADVLAVAAELTAADADWQLHAYGHTLHAFTFPAADAPERGIAYNPDADRRSWAAMRSFLDEVLT